MKVSPATFYVSRVVVLDSKFELVVDKTFKHPIIKVIPMDTNQVLVGTFLYLEVTGGELCNYRFLDKTVSHCV